MKTQSFQHTPNPVDAGLDLTAISTNATNDYIEYKTGISIEIPAVYVGLLFPRSSNSKKDLLLANSVGVIDSSYRGEICLRYKIVYDLFHKPRSQCGIYNPVDKCGQLIIIPYPDVEFVEVDELGETERSGAVFGLTGS